MRDGEGKDYLPQHRWIYPRWNCCLFFCSSLLLLLLFLLGVGVTGMLIIETHFFAEYRSKNSAAVPAAGRRGACTPLSLSPITSVTRSFYFVAPPLSPFFALLHGTPSSSFCQDVCIRLPRRRSWPLVSFVWYFRRVLVAPCSYVGCSGGGGGSIDTGEGEE